MKVSELLVGGAVGLQKEWVTEEVVKDSETRRGGWDLVRASSASLNIFLWIFWDFCEVAGPSKLQSGAKGVVGTLCRS